MVAGALAAHFLEFSRVSEVSEAIGQVVAGALAAHFPRVFTCFWSLGSFRAGDFGQVVDI